MDAESASWCDEEAEEEKAAGLITAEWFGRGTCRWFTDNGWRFGATAPKDSRAEDAAPLLATVDDMAGVSLSKKKKKKYNI